jgi:hypothetical protein
MATSASFTIHRRELLYYVALVVIYTIRDVRVILEFEYGVGRVGVGVGVEFDVEVQFGNSNSMLK